MATGNILNTVTERLKDGQFILSPMLTNLYEAAHGNGILLYEDAATSTGGIRTNPAALPGAITASNNVLTIKGGYAVIDGLLVDFARGIDESGTNDPPNTYTLTLQDSTIVGSNTALQEVNGVAETCLLVVYVCTNGVNTNPTDAHHIQVEMGTAVTTGFPITPDDFLVDPNSNFSSKQSTVLAVLKAEYISTGGGDLNLNVTTVYDTRTFIRTGSPMYLAPMTKDQVGVFTNRIDNHTDLDGMHGGGTEGGSLEGSKFGAIWMSNNETNDSILYFSGEQGSNNNRYSWRLGPPVLVTDTDMDANLTFKKDGGNFFHLTPTGDTRQLNPVGEFPISHTIHVYNYSGSETIQFNGTADGLSGGTYNQSDNAFNVSNGQSIIFSFNGEEWKQSFVSGNANTSVAGSADGEVQLKNGNNFGASSNFTFNTSTNVLTISGKVSMNNLLENPTGIDFTTGTAAPAGATAAETLWMGNGSSGTENYRLYVGTTKVLMDGDAVGATTLLGLTDTPADYTGDSGKIVAVNAGNGTDGTALEFRDLVTGDIPSTLSTVTQIGPADGVGSGILTVTNDLTVTGDLIVNGTNTVINSTTLQVDDKQIELAHSPSGSEGDDAAVAGAGILVRSSDSDKSILWNGAGNSTTAWEFSHDIFPISDSSVSLGSSGIRFLGGFFDASNITALTAGTITGTGDVTIATDALKVDTTNDRVGVKQATPISTFQYEEVGHGYAEATSTTESNTAEALTLFGVTEFRAAEVLISIEDTTNSIYEVHKAVLVHAGSGTPEFTVHDKLVTTGSTFCATAADINSNNVRILITPQATGTAYTFRVAWKGIAKV